RMAQVTKIEKIDGLTLARLEVFVNGDAIASEHLSSTAAGLFRHRYMGSEFTPPVCFLKFPIRSGDTWESEHQSGELRFKVACRVGSDEVEVPAGKFKAVTATLTVTV